MTFARLLIFLIAVAFAIGLSGPLLAGQASGGGPNGVAFLTTPVPRPHSTPKHSPQPTPIPSPTPTPSPTPRVSTAISSPAKLRLVYNASECASHGGAAAESKCRAALPTSLTLTFEWSGNKRYSAADGFNVYEVDGGKRAFVERIEPHPTVAIVSYTRGWATKNNEPEQCYAISALVGKLESPLSAKYCGAAISYTWRYDGAEHCATQIRVTYSWVDAPPGVHWSVDVTDTAGPGVVHYHKSGYGSMPAKTAVIAVPLDDSYPPSTIGGVSFYFFPKYGPFTQAPAGGGIGLSRHRPCRGH